MKLNPKAIPGQLRTLVNQIFSAGAPIQSLKAAPISGIDVPAFVRPSTITPEDTVISNIISDLFKTEGTDTNMLSLNGFLGHAFRHHEARSGGEPLHGMDFGDMTYLFTTPRHPHHALLVSYNQALIDEVRTLCATHGHDARLAPTVAGEKIFMTYQPIDPNAKRAQREMVKIPAEHGLLLTHFDQLDLNRIKDAGIQLTKGLAAQNFDGFQSVHKDLVLYDVLVTKLTQTAQRQSAIEGFKRRVLNRLGREKPVLMAA